MKRSILVASSILALAFAAPAGAQDDFDWTGFYAGLQAGYGFGETDHEFSNGAPSGESDLDGFVGGGHAGWLGQSGSLVYGLEVDGEYASGDGAFTNGAGITSQGAADIDWLASARARLGVAYGPWLPYVTGGAAFGGFDFAGGPAGGPLTTFESTEIGWTAGGGLERLLSERVSAGVEYRYTDFGDETGELLPAFPGAFMEVDSRQHGARARISLHF